MANKNRVSLSSTGFKEMIENLDKLQGDLEKTTERALLAGKAVVVHNLVSATHKANYPAGGKYSTGSTRHSINTDKHVNWQGTVASIGVGFDWDESGMTSIFLMYGTPKMPKVQAIYDAIYGNKVKSQVRKVQKDIFANAIKEKMEG